MELIKYSNWIIKKRFKLFRGVSPQLFSQSCHSLFKLFTGLISAAFTL